MFRRGPQEREGGAREERRSGRERKREELEKMAKVAKDRRPFLGPCPSATYAIEAHCAQKKTVGSMNERKLWKRDKKSEGLDKKKKIRVSSC